MHLLFHLHCVVVVRLEVAPSARRHVQGRNVNTKSSDTTLGTTLAVPTLTNDVMDITQHILHFSHVAVHSMVCAFLHIVAWTSSIEVYCLPLQVHLEPAK